jgi:hypothetical protein
VIFEAGFSESYQDLLSDADDWISHSRGQVQLVVLINFEEDVHHRKEYQRSQQSRDRVQTLLRDFGNSMGRTAHLEGSDDGMSDSMYDQIENRIVSEGPWMPHSGSQGPLGQRSVARPS